LGRSAHGRGPKNPKKTVFCRVWGGKKGVGVKTGVKNPGKKGNTGGDLRKNGGQGRDVERKMVKKEAKKKKSSTRGEEL